MWRSGADNPFPSIRLIKSVKMWEWLYFYVKNVSAEGDWVNLPAYVAGPPPGRQPSWSFRARSLTPAGAGVVARLRVLIQSEHLTRPLLRGSCVVRLARLGPSRESWMPC